MLKILDSGKIELTRGDTARLTVFPKIGEGEEKQDYIVREDDLLTFTVKKSYEDEVPAIEKKLTGSTTFHIEPKDTKELTFGKYKYDIQLTMSNGDNYTFIADKEFIITKEVG